MSKHKRMEVRVLDCVLTDEEIEAKASELARITIVERDQSEALEVAIEGYKNDKKNRESAIKSTRGQVIALARAVSTRQMERDVPCDWNYHLESNSAILVRRDTGTAVERRNITEEERQLKIGETLESANVEQIRVWEEQLAKSAAQPPTDSIDSAEGEAPATA